jgi:sugar phosphate isomerase/epimerase
LKLAIMHPSVLAKGLDDLEELTRRGIAGVQVQPSLFLDEEGKLKQPSAKAAKPFEAAGLTIPAWCAYRTLIGPENDVAANVQAQKRVITLASRFRTLTDEDVRPIVCTETGDPASHPDRSGGSLWAQLTEAVAELAAHAAKRDVCVAIEPTRSHIVDSSVAARRLLDQIASSHLGICFDPANVCGDKDHLGRAIHLLSDAIVLVHAKDVVFSDDGNVADYPPAGKGQLDYARFIELCSEIEACRYLVLEYLRTPDQADEAIAFVQALLPPEEAT